MWEMPGNAEPLSNRVSESFREDLVLEPGGRIENVSGLCRGFLDVGQINPERTLSVEKIPVVLRPVIKLPVKSMASIGIQEIRKKAEIFIDYGEILKRLAGNYR